jgi:hypothetical protein
MKLAGHAPVVGLAVCGMVAAVKGTQKLPCKVNPLGQVPLPAYDVVLLTEPVVVPWAHNEAKVGGQACEDAEEDVLDCCCCCCCCICRF